MTGHSTLRCAALYGAHAPQDAAKMAIKALEAEVAAPVVEVPRAATETGTAAVG